MRFNANTALSTPKLLLVPYKPHHVPAYRTWMQSPTLLAATASEPLTLEEEYAMQRSWREDLDKLTFIICFPISASRPNDQPNQEPTKIHAGPETDGPDRMIGDVNLFLYPCEPDDDSSPRPVPPKGEQKVIGEIEIMLPPSPLTTRKGYARAALVAFMHYILSHWDDISKEYSAGQKGSSLSSEAPKLAYLRALINVSNTASLGLFESVGFQRLPGKEGGNYFGEVELRFHGDVKEVERLKWFEGVRELDYVDLEGEEGS